MRLGSQALGKSRRLVGVWPKGGSESKLNKIAGEGIFFSKR